jgi:hypothetical protein
MSHDIVQEWTGYIHLDIEMNLIIINVALICNVPMLAGIHPEILTS